MLNQICRDWNESYQNHKSTISSSAITVHENDQGARFKDLIIHFNEAMEIPSKQFSGFNHWGCFSNSNCDGLFLVAVSEGIYDLVAVELKSTFATNHLYEAKEQIMVSIHKSLVLLDSLASFSHVEIRSIYGIVVSLSPTDADWAWVRGKSEINRTEWGEDTVGLSLVIDGQYKVKRPKNRLCDRICPKVFDIFYLHSKTSSLDIDLPLA